MTKGEFRGIRTQDQFAEMIADVMKNAEEVKHLDRGRIAYWKNKVVVIRNSNLADGYAAFAPGLGKKYFDERLK